MIRIMVGLVFLSEGIQKFLFPLERGSGRFEKIGLPYPEVLGPFVGGAEVVCGTLVIMGLATRLAAIPLMVIMIVALSVTKIPILADAGLWQALHDSRTDLSMLLGSIFLLINGGGAWSIDRRLINHA